MIYPQENIYRTICEIEMEDWNKNGPHKQEKKPGWLNTKLYSLAANIFQRILDQEVHLKNLQEISWEPNTLAQLLVLDDVEETTAQRIYSTILPIFTQNLANSLSLFNQWMQEDCPLEHRATVNDKILRILSEPSQNTLDLQNLKLSRRLPDIFHPYFITSKQLSQQLKILDLSKNQLTTLADTIGELGNLTDLNLYGNQLSKLPDTIGKLSTLTNLDVSENILQKLPEQIGDLNALLILNLCGNQLKTVPQAMGKLSTLMILNLCRNQLKRVSNTISKLDALTDLNLCGNELKRLPHALCKLSNLTELNLSENLLTELPGAIDSWRALTSLDVSDNLLMTLPEKIGSLSDLRTLTLSSNEDLAGLPSEILDLPQTCTITLDGCSSLSQAILERLGEVCSAPGYHGPTISYSMTPAHPTEEEKEIEDVLKDLYQITGQPYRELANTLQEDGAKKAILKSWLSRLSYMSDYKASPELRTWLASNVVHYLERAGTDEVFRQTFQTTIDGAAATCGDRVALSIIHVGIAYRLAMIDKSDLQGLAELLVRGTWAVDLLEKIARKKVNQLKFFDEIEVYLAYLVKLKETLQLLIDINDMLYFSCSHVIEEDLSHAALEVLNQLANRAYLDFLVDQPEWKKALAKAYAPEYASLEKEKEEATDKAIAQEDGQPDWQQIEAKFKEGLQTLTERALEEDASRPWKRLHIAAENA